MSHVTANDLVRAIGLLNRNRDYNYINSKTANKIRIISVTEPEGPIVIARYNPKKGKKRSEAKRQSMSTQMLWRYANAIKPDCPLNVDRVMGGSYNTRSVLESLLAHTPQFVWCTPGRIESTSSATKIQKGHKHLMWVPDNPHPAGVTAKIDTDIVISELPTSESVYGALILPETTPEDAGLDIDIKRRHAQIQVRLVMIGQHLKYRTWVAQNDKGIVYNNRKLGEMDNVIASLNAEKLLQAYGEAAKAAALIDCVWFYNSRFMPAVMEIEHTTGVTPGLTRMQNFCDRLPPFTTRWVIVAPDDARKKVVAEANKPQFQKLKARFFPYSAVEELYALCQRRKIRGVTDEFLDCFMEPCST